MKTTELLRRWDDTKGQLDALTRVQKRIVEGADIAHLRDDVTKEIGDLTQSACSIDEALHADLFRLLQELGLVDASPEMKYQWESFAGGRDRAVLIRVLTELKETGDSIGGFLNRVCPIDSE